MLPLWPDAQKPAHGLKQAKEVAEKRGSIFSGALRAMGWCPGLENPIDGQTVMSEPFEAQGKLKLRPAVPALFFRTVKPAL